MIDQLSIAFELWRGPFREFCTMDKTVRHVLDDTEQIRGISFAGTPRIRFPPELGRPVMCQNWVDEASDVDWRSDSVASLCRGALRMA